MTPALEQAVLDRIALEGPCRCGSWSGLEVVMPELSDRASSVRWAEELAKAPLRCKTCRHPSPGPFVAETVSAARLAVQLPEVSVPARALGKSDSANQPGAAAVTAYLSGMGESSRRGMRDALNLLARMLGQEKAEGIAWHELRFERTSALQAELVASGRNPDYSKKIVGALKGVLKASEQLGLMRREDLERAIRLSKIRGSRIRRQQQLDEGDVEKLLASTRSDSKRFRAMRDRALIALLVGGGLRRAEAAYVTMDHFNRATRLLVVRGKGDKERLVPLPQWAAKAITDFIDARGFGGPIICPVSQKGVCERRALSGGQATYAVARKLWRRAKLEPVGVHAFRRDFCHRVVDAGADIFQAQQLLGHSDPKTTAEYAGRTVEKLAVATQRLADPEACA